MEKSFHSICTWTFNAGKGGFTPGNQRPAWAGSVFRTVDAIRLIAKEIAPRLPRHIVLGLEAHYDYEYDEASAGEVAAALRESGLYLAMATPGAHRHFGYGGIASPDPRERAAAAEFGARAVDLAYGPLKKAWMPGKPPTLVLWNGSWGYDLATPAIAQMYSHLKENVAALCRHEQRLGGRMFIAIEPKPNEGHPAMLLPTVASAIVFWKKLQESHGIDLRRKGVNKEFGHSEMIGLDAVHDTVEEIDHRMLVHMHINSQGYNDGLILGGPGKYDIDHGARINGMNVAVARLVLEAGYDRWKGHDMQARAYDDERQAMDRIVRSILSWEACEQAARRLKRERLDRLLARRETARAEDLMRDAVADAQAWFRRNYR